MCVYILYTLEVQDQAKNCLQDDPWIQDSQSYQWAKFGRLGLPGYISICTSQRIHGTGIFDYIYIPTFMDKNTPNVGIYQSHGSYGIHTEGVQPHSASSEALLKCWRHQAVISFQTSLPLKFLSDGSWRSQPDSLFRPKPGERWFRRNCAILNATKKVLQFVCLFVSLFVCFVGWFLTVHPNCHHFDEDQIWGLEPFGPTWNQTNQARFGEVGLSLTPRRS